MNGWRNSPKVLVFIITVVMGTSLLASLSGCGNENSPIRYVIDAVRGENFQLSEESARQLERFEAVYGKYADGGNGKQINHFRAAYKRVRAKYVREVSDVKLIDAAIKGLEELKAEPGSQPPPVLMEAALDTMLASLDPHSRYLNPEEYRETQLSTRGEFGGLGIQVSLEDDLIKVISPIEDTPAFRAGIKAGDRITHLDGESIRGKTLMYAVNRMRGKPGTDLILTIQREGEASFDVTITRAIIRVKAVRWHTEGGIGYLRVTNFNEKVENNLVKAIDAIEKELGPRLKGVVLDLRNNPGGLLLQSVNVTDAFLDKGRIVSVLGRFEKDNHAYDARPGDMINGLPMVVLINGGSASASEIVAGALQDNGRAVVMGKRSFGKGSVQTITPLPTEGALKLTTQLYYSPSGRAIQALGVAPDIVLNGEVGKEDKRQHETDLPGALPAVSDEQKRTLTALKETDCPAAAGRNDKKDYQLGCALAWLNAGSMDRFLASIHARPAM